MQLEINDTLTIREKQFQCVWISPEPTEVTSKWHNIFQVLKEKNYQHRILHLTKVTCRNSQMKESYENLSLVSQPFSSVQFICSVVSDSLQPHGLQHVRPPCPSPTPWVHSNSCPSSQWCHSTISSSVIPFSSCLQSFPTSESFPVSQFFTSGGQSIGASAWTSVLPMNIQDLFTLGLAGWSPCSPGDSQESSPTPQFKSINSLVLSFFHGPTVTSIHDYWKNHSLD